MKSKLLIPILMGMSVRNFLKTGVFNKLDEEFDLTFVVLDNDKYIINELLTHGYKYIDFRRTFMNKVFFRVSYWFQKLQYYSFFQKHNTLTMKKYILRDKLENPFKFNMQFNLSKIIGFFYSKNKFVSFFYKFMLSFSLKKKILEFDKVLLLSTDVVLDKAILYFLNSKSIKSYVIPHSWDNLPARGYMSSKCHKMLVWNSFMKNEATVLHGLEDKNIDIVGIPQYNYYLNLSKKISYNDFIDYYKLKKFKKVVTYTCNSIRIFPDEDLFIDNLIKICAKHNFNLIVRLHPSERKDYFKSRYNENKDVVLDEPTNSFAATILDEEKTNNEDISILKFISLMKYSDVVINLASTISLDAIIFDTPVICPRFNIDKNLDNTWNSSKNWYNSSHFTNINKSNAVKFADDLIELEEKIILYVNDQSIDSLYRKKLAEEMCSINLDAVSNIVKALKDFK